MNQPIRIIEKTPLGYIVELLDNGTRMMLPKLILNHKIKLGVYTLTKQPISSESK